MSLGKDNRKCGRSLSYLYRSRLKMPERMNMNRSSPEVQRRALPKNSLPVPLGRNSSARHTSVLSGPLPLLHLRPWTQTATGSSLRNMAPLCQHGTLRTISESNSCARPARSQRPPPPPPTDRLGIFSFLSLRLQIRAGDL